MKTLIVLLLLLPAFVCAEGWDKKDKVLYGMVVGFQITDGLTTADHLRKGGHIYNAWAWKYGTDRPSPLRLWGVKAAELGVAYVVADKMPSKYRKPFLAIVAGTLAIYTMDHMSKGAGITVTW